MVRVNRKRCYPAADNSTAVAIGAANGDDDANERACGGAVVTALASRDRRLRVRSRTLPCVGHPATVTSPEVGGPNGETAVNPPKRIC